MADRTGKANDAREIVTRFVYEKTGGTIVHVHQVINLPGAPALDHATLDTTAHEVACESSGKKASELAVLRASMDDLEVGRQYRVDVKTKRLRLLVVTPAKKTAARRKPAARKG